MSAARTQDVIDTYRTLLRVARRIKRIIRPILAEWGLTGAQFGSLSRIPPEGISLTDLASMSSADPATVSGIVDRLVQAGFVRRERSDKDRRAIRITLTERGRMALDAVLPLHRRAVTEAFSPLDPGELASLQALLKRVDRHLAGPVTTEGTGATARTGETGETKEPGQTRKTSEEDRP